MKHENKDDKQQEEQRRGRKPRKINYEKRTYTQWEG